MKNKSLLCLLVVILLGIISCSDDQEQVFPPSGSLKVVHGAMNAPGVHIGYFNSENEIVYSANPILSFGRTQRFTIPADEERSVRFVNSNDTTSTILNTELNLKAGQIITLFLTGDSIELSATLIGDIGHTTIRDSINTVRFVNMTSDVNSLNVSLDGSDTNIASDLTFSQPTDFIEFDATLENLNYTFNFINGSGDIISSFQLRQFFVIPGRPPFVLTFRKNITLALVGAEDDGEGNNTLRVIQVNNF